MQILQNLLSNGMSGTVNARSMICPRCELRRYPTFFFQQFLSGAVVQSYRGIPLEKTIYCSSALLQNPKTDTNPNKIVPTNGRTVLT